MFSLEEIPAETPPASPSTDEENLCTISRQAVDGSSDPGVLQLHAWIQGQEVLLLIDSGSSTSFVDSTLAAKLQGVTTLPKACRVKIADGAIIQCNSYVPACSWTTQGHPFVTDFKIIKLGAYDAILGMDWLRQHSPMHIDWDSQHMQVSPAKGQVTL